MSISTSENTTYSMIPIAAHSEKGKTIAMIRPRDQEKGKCWSGEALGVFFRVVKLFHAIV